LILIASFSDQLNKTLSLFLENFHLRQKHDIGFFVDQTDVLKDQAVIITD